MNLEEALSLANRIYADLTPFTVRREIAGSVRRRKPDDIKDVEIVCIAKTMPLIDMFGVQTGELSLLESAFRGLLQEWNACTIRNGPKYKQILFPGGQKFDLFIATPETWGYKFAICTGPADYSHWLVTPRNQGGGLPSYLTVKEARLWKGTNALDTSEEQSFFDALELPMPEPWERKAPVKFMAGFKG